MAAQVAPDLLEHEGRRLGTQHRAWSSLVGLQLVEFLNPTTGVVSGIPAASGSFTATVTITDSALDTFVTTMTFTVGGGTPTTLSFSQNANLGTFLQGTTFTSINLTPTGGTAPYLLTALTPLPPGFALVPTTTAPTGNMAFAGIATVPGAYTFSVMATDANGNVGVRAFSLTALSYSFLNSTTTLPDATAGTAYSRTFATVGGSATWTLAPGSILPPGITVSPAGVLSGTPTANGTFSFILTAASDGTTRNTTLSLRVSPMTNTSVGVLPAAVVDVPYTFTFTATGGTGTKTWSATGLPVRVLAFVRGSADGQCRHVARWHDDDARHHGDEFGCRRLPGADSPLLVVVPVSEPERAGHFGRQLRHHRGAAGPGVQLHAGGLWRRAAVCLGPRARVDPAARSGALFRRCAVPRDPLLREARLSRARRQLPADLHLRPDRHRLCRDVAPADVHAEGVEYRTDEYLRDACERGDGHVLLAATGRRWRHRPVYDNDGGHRPDAGHAAARIDAVFERVDFRNTPEHRYLPVHPDAAGFAWSHLLAHDDVERRQHDCRRGGRGSRHHQHESKRADWPEPELLTVRLAVQWRRHAIHMVGRRKWPAPASEVPSSQAWCS